MESIPPLNGFRVLLVVSRRTETVIGPVHQPETNRLRCTYLAVFILAAPA
jgi:hypothetical protein